MGFSIFDERELVNDSYYADSSTADAFYQIGGHSVFAERIDAFLLSSNSASDQIVEVGIKVGALTYPLGQVTVPALAGTIGVPVLDAVLALAPLALGAIIVQKGSGFMVRQTVTLTGSDAILGVTIGGYLE